jgi:hypothetical protein
MIGEIVGGPYIKQQGYDNYVKSNGVRIYRPNAFGDVDGEGVWGITNTSISPSTTTNTGTTKLDGDPFFDRGWRFGNLVYKNIGYTGRVNLEELADTVGLNGELGLFKLTKNPPTEDACNASFIQTNSNIGKISVARYDCYNVTSGFPKGGVGGATNLVLVNPSGSSYAYNDIAIPNFTNKIWESIDERIEIVDIESEPATGQWIDTWCKSITIKITKY